jgi:heme exporter protein B
MPTASEAPPVWRDAIGQAIAIAAKDLMLEARSRERLIGMLTFAVLVAVVFSFALDPSVRGSSIGGAMLWITVIFAGMLGLGRSFTLERDQDAMSGILLAPVGRGAIFAGKFIANLVLLLLAELVIFPIYALFFNLGFGGQIWQIALVAVLASVGFMALGTLFSAMAINTRLGDTAIPVLLLPLLIPIVIFAAGATQRLLAGRPLGEVAGGVRVLLAFDIIFLIVCTLMFEPVVEE